MGVEYYMVCNKCKEYIDLHKSYYFAGLLYGDSPPGPKGTPNEYIKNSLDSFWAGRGIWFMWRHKDCGKLKMHSDHDYDWFEFEPYLNEVFKFLTIERIFNTTFGGHSD